MGSLQAIRFLQCILKSLRHPDSEPPEQRLFTVEVPSWRSGLIEFADAKDWEVDLLVQAAPYGALSGGRLTLAAKAQPMSRAQAVSVLSWGDWGDGAQFDDPYDIGHWGKEEGSENKWALILLADCFKDRKSIEVDLKPQEPERSNIMLVAMLPLTTGNLVGVWGRLVTPDANGSYRRLGGFQLRAGRQTGGRPESSVFKFFEEAETRTLRMVRLWLTKDKQHSVYLTHLYHILLVSDRNH